MIFLKSTQQLISASSSYPGKNVSACCGHTPQISHTLRGFGLSENWEGEAGDRAACLEKHQAQEIQFLWLFHRHRAALHMQESAERHEEAKVDESNTNRRWTKINVGRSRQNTNGDLQPRLL